MAAFLPMVAREISYWGSILRILSFISPVNELCAFSLYKPIIFTGGCIAAFSSNY